MVAPQRDLTGEQARQLIDEILARTMEDFILHLSWKKSGNVPQKEEQRKEVPVKIEQHLSFHGTWTAQEILATGKGRNRQIEELILRSMGKGGGK